MNTEIITGMRPKITLMMILCGITSAASMGAVSVAAADEFIPRLDFKFDPHSLDTESGTRELYVRLKNAAEAACPAPTTGSRLATGAILRCREELISGVVLQINNPRLVALYNNHAKNS